MSGSPGKMLVLAGEQFACVKIIGRANFGSSIDFRTLVNELRQKNYNFFVLDLSECTLMDSTFLGVLTGFGLKMSPDPEQGGDGSIELLNANARITELLENLGVLHLFKLTHGELKETSETETHTHVNCVPTKLEVTEACLEAHRTLMAVNPENVARFKDVTTFLAEDLKRLRTT